MPVSAASERYELVVGLEVHVQLLTRSKAFSPDAAAFGAEPNTHVDPVTLGHPGTLPVLNEDVVRLSVTMGLATNCHIRERSVFARKHYLYPDLPKGYQISQYETPICFDGWLDVEDDAGGTRRVRLHRIHMEEDAGKLIHDADPYATLVDHNRCGVPLIEIVTEPDLRSPGEAVRTLVHLRQTVRYLGIGDGNMEEGSFRCDANVSVRPRGTEALGTKTEVKNLNSFRHVERAIAHEAARQIAVLEAGGRVVQETRLWDAAREVTRSMRSKEEAHDYRYFPDPDLAQVVVSAADVEAARASMPELPAARRARLTGALGLPAADAEILTDDRATADLFEDTLRALAGATPTPDEAKAVSNLLLSDVRRAMNERGLAPEAFDAERLAALVRLRLDGRIGSSAASEIVDAMLDSDESPEALAEARGLFQVSDTGALEPVVAAVLADHPAQVQQYLDGETKVVGFFIGQTMKRFEGSPDPQLVRSLLLQKLAALAS